MLIGFLQWLAKVKLKDSYSYMPQELASYLATFSLLDLWGNIKQLVSKEVHDLEKSIDAINHRIDKIEDNLKELQEQFRGDTISNGSDSTLDIQRKRKCTLGLQV